VPWLGIGSFCAEALLGGVSLKRLSKSGMKQEETVLYNGGDSGIKLVKDALGLSHLALPSEPDCVCDVSNG